MKKPIVINRPWWRHRIFPWVWNLLSEVNPHLSNSLNVSGYYSPGDGGGGLFTFVPHSSIDNEGSIIKLVPRSESNPVEFPRNQQ